ncbi:HD-GYP domain-containing protein [bacterium]|nr:HD-GYP domain-containing protein [bacterium]
MASLEVEIAERKCAEEALEKSHNRLRQALEGTITAIAKAVEARDLYIAGHQRRVAQLACAIAEEMGLNAEQIEGIHMGAMIHDIGKIHLPAEILGKPAKLLDTEYALIKSHPKVGYEILKDIEFPWPVAAIVHQHHEHLDGSGYPQGLVGNDILLEARIVCVADVVEAIADHRPYRPALGTDNAFIEIENNKNVLYDREVVDACLNIFRKKHFSFDDSQMS